MLADRIHRLITLGGALVASTLVAGTEQVPVPIADIYSRSGGGSISGGAELDGFYYYGACYQEDFFGCELVRTPIGGSGIERVKDINPGTGGSDPRDFLRVGDTLYFRANGSQLWRTDGTEAGTQIVRGFANLPSPSSEFTRWASVGGELFFRAEDSSTRGRELWKTDGTTTTRIDLCPGSCDGDPAYLSVAGGRLLFRANDGTDTELWKYESGSASQVGDINPGGGSSFPDWITSLGSTVVFQAQDGVELGLWASDGSTNTKIAGSAQFFFGFTELAVAGGLAYFDGFDGNQISGRELWISNGTPGGTGLIKDIRPGVPSSEPEDFAAVGSSMYFTANDGANGRELWISTGSGANTVPLELVPGPGSPSDLRAISDLNGGQAFFIADDGGGFGAEPWVSDGTPGGTVRVADLDPGPDSGISEPVVTTSGFAFFASDALDDGDELWRSDGTAGGTAKLTELGIGSSGAGIDDIVSFSGLGYFCADDGIAGNELWRTDGTAVGTFLLQDLNPGPGFGCGSGGITVLGGALYFGGYDGSDFGLWKSNGQPGGAVFVKAFTAEPQQLTPHAGALYFVADDGGGAGAELWRSDGTTGGTTLVKDLYPGGLPANITDLTSVGGFLYFGGRFTTTGDFELWKSDGSGAGTGVLKDIFPGPGGSFPQNFGSVGGTVLFTATDGTNGEEVWRTDGTAGGTVLLKDINPSGSGSNSVDGFFELGGFAYFEASDGTNGYELWRTDGSTANTLMVSDIRPGSGSSSPRDFAVVGSKLLFTADDGSAGREPWSTDGSTTSLLRDIDPTGSSDARAFFATGVGDEAYFQADDGIGGAELFFTDGTTGGTGKVADLTPDGGSSPRNFAATASRIVFTAGVGFSGTELWSFGAADCGDAPDPTYPTLLLTSAACHTYEPAASSLRLGATRDAEVDGQPTTGADGDDADGSDDEDGVVFTSDFDLGGVATFDVTVSDPGFLNVWIDWSADGDWNDLEDLAILNEPLAAGVHSLAVPVPTDAAIGDTYARFRVDTAGTPYPSGIVFDGEVEDYRITLTEALDFGDAPDPLDGTAGGYPTLLANDGARHRVVAGVHLGAGVDDEPDGQPSPSADGDDTGGFDDEDGVVFTSALVPGADATATVTASVAGYLSAWVDFDADGTWNDVEELILDGESVVAGANDFVFAVPAAAATGATFARFRFDTQGDGYVPTGFVEDGEVEDYSVAVGALADLGVVKSAPSTAVPGDAIQFTIVASNPTGPATALGATVTDAFSAELSSCDWTCSGSGGGNCAASGSGDVSEPVDLPPGGSVTFAATCTIDADAVGELDNTATVVPPLGVSDPNAGNDSSTSTTSLQPTADLSITKTDGEPWVIPPATLVYTIQVESAGPSDVLGASVEDLFPAEVTGVTWTCVGADGGVCAVSGSGDIDESVDLPAGAAVTFTATADTAGDPGDSAVNTATVSAPVGVFDPQSANDSSTDVTQFVDGLDIFMDGFESGDTSAWSGTVGGAGPVVELASGADVWEAELTLSTRAIERAGRRSTPLVIGQGPGGGAVFRVAAETADGLHRLRPEVRDAAGRWISGTSSTLERVPHRLELTWRRALGDGVSDGLLLLEADGAIVGLVEGVDNSGAALSRVLVGGARDSALVVRVDDRGWRDRGGVGLLGGGRGER